MFPYKTNAISADYSRRNSGNRYLFAIALIILLVAAFSIFNWSADTLGLLWGPLPEHYA